MKNLTVILLLLLVLALVTRPLLRKTQLEKIGGEVLKEVIQKGTKPSEEMGNPFGVMIPSVKLPNERKVEIAKDDLKAVYYRPLSVFVDRWNGTCAECDAAVKAGLKLVLTVRNNGGKQAGGPTTPPTDLAIYKKKIGEIVGKYKPEVLVVENEENSAALFYQGTPAQYHEQLKTACEVAHAQSIKCTNGGLVSSLVAALVANDYIEKGDPKKADEYLKRTLRPEQYQQYQKTAGKKALTDQVARGKQLLAGYKAAGADYVNFHWYIADTDALAEAVAYLTRVTGLPAMTNEVGQQGNESPEQVKNVMAKMVDLSIPYALWFSGDVEGYGGARSLLNPDGSLRPNGEAFDEFIETNF